MPCRIASIWELSWAQGHKLPMPKRVVYEYATREDAERARAVLQRESGLVDDVLALKYGPGPSTINGTEYVVTYAGQNET